MRAIYIYIYRERERERVREREKVTEIESTMHSIRLLADIVCPLLFVLGQGASAELRAKVSELTHKYSQVSYLSSDSFVS